MLLMKRIQALRASKFATICCTIGFSAIVGCDLVAGIGTYCVEGTDPDCGTGADGGWTTTGTASTSQTCDPGVSMPCYEGPLETEAIGACKSGSAQCDAAGVGYGPCIGQVLPAVEDCATPENEDCSTSPDCGSCLWNIAFPRPEPTAHHYPVRMAVDPAGNRYLGFHAIGPIDLGCEILADGPTPDFDVVVAKLDGTGKCIWSKRFGDEAGQYLADLAVDSQGDVILAGSFEGIIDFEAGPLSSLGADFYLTKLDTNGDAVWSRSFGDDSEEQVAASLSVDAAGSIIVVGTFRGLLSFGEQTPTLANESPSDALFLSKFDSSGVTLWSRAYAVLDANGYVRGQAVASEPTGGAYVAAHLRGNVTLPPTREVSAANLQAMMLTKFTADGIPEWNKIYQTTEAAVEVSDATADSGGNALFTGRFWGTLAFGSTMLTSPGGYAGFVTKVDALGSHQWSASLGSNASTPSVRAVGVSTDDAMNAFVAGDFKDFGDFGCGTLDAAGDSDVFVTKFDSVGKCSWSKRFGDPNEQRADDVAATASSVTVFGRLSGSADAGCGVVSSDAGESAFLLTVAP